MNFCDNYPKTKKSKAMLSSDTDGKCALIDVEKSIKKAHFSKHTKPVRDILISPLSSFAISYGQDNTIYMWDLPNCELVGKLNNPVANDEIVSMKFDGTGMLLGGLTSNGSVYVWDLTQLSLLGSLVHTQDELNSITCFDMAYDGSFVAAGNRKGHIVAYSTDFKYQDCLYRHSKSVAEICISSSVETILSRGCDGDCFSLHSVLERRSRRIEVDSEITGIGYTANGNSLYTNQRGIGCAVFDAQGNFKQMLESYGSPIHSKFSYDGDCCIMVDSNSLAYVYGYQFNS